MLAPGDPWVIDAKKHRRPPVKPRHIPNGPIKTAVYSESNLTPSQTLSETEMKHENVYEKEHGKTFYENPSHDGTKEVGEEVAAPMDGVHHQQPRWAIWVAAALGAAGLALLATAWQLEPF